MEKNISRTIDIDELRDLAVIGGSDGGGNGGDAGTNAVTTPLCAVISITLISAISITYITSANPELC